VEPELESRRDPEVAAPATDRPEQIRLRVSVDAEEAAVGGHQLRREKVVDRQPELADQVADPAAERDPADPDGAGVTEAGDQTVLADRGCVLGRRHAGRRPGGPSLDVDLDAIHV
jgi:hypothetical protein